MPEAHSPLDWRNSKAHWFLLGKFIHPHAPDEFAASDHWRSVLREDPTGALQRFVKEGLLASAELFDLIGYKYKVPELKQMLRERDLPVSGKKDEMVARLLQTDSAAMTAATAGLTLLVVTPNGRGLAQQYLSDERAKRARLEDTALDLLRKRMFREASIAVATYEADQVFPRGLGIDWHDRDPSGDIGVLQTIFESHPKILSNLSAHELDALRLGAGMMHLFGTNRCKPWLPDDLKTSLRMDNDSAGRMVLFYAWHEKTLAQYRESRVVAGIRIRAVPDSCDACKALDGKQFALHNVPELPNPLCTHEMGCRCAPLPLVEGVNQDDLRAGRKG